MSEKPSNLGGGWWGKSLEDVINTCVVDHIPDTKSPDCN